MIYKQNRVSILKPSFETRMNHVFFFYIFSIYSTYISYKDWKDNPIITTVNTTAYPIEDIDYPAITICSQGASKDVMDGVLLRQFEDWLKSKGITPGKAKNNHSGNSTSKIVKRSIPLSPSNVAYKLSKQEVRKSEF